MWLLNFLPEWIFHALLLAGLAGIVVTYFAKFIPFVSTYTDPIRVVSVIIVAASLWFEGGISNEAKWTARVAEVQTKVAAAEVQSVKETIKVVERVVVKQQIVRERGQDIIKFVDKEIIKYDNICVIPKEFITIHNKAAEVPK